MTPESETAKILIVDDLPEKVLVLETVLAELPGIQIHAATSGEAALQQVLENDFAVILLDINMPGMDGFETASFIRGRKRSAHTPIIFVTAFADEMLAARSYSLGAVDYILSPVVPDVLRSKVAVFIDLYRLTQQVRKQAVQEVQLAREQAARAAAESASCRAHYLSEASRNLASTLDSETIWQALGRLTVPTLTQFCGVSRVDPEGKLSVTELIWCDRDGDIHSRRLANGSELHASLADSVARALDERDVVKAPFSAEGWSESVGTQSVPWLEHNRTNEAASLVSIPFWGGERVIGVLTLAIGGDANVTVDIAFAQDLAARAAIALENAGLCEGIREAGRRKDEFLAMLAHELRNPLAPIRFAVEIFRLVGVPDPSLEQPLEMIDRQVTHMSRMIEELLDFSRLSRGKILLRKEPVDLRDIVRSVVDDMRSTFEENQLTLHAKLPGGPVVVHGDATRLAQIVTNVLQNANKFTDPGGAVCVELETESEESACLVISDTGIGMEPEMLERAFESFSQADHSLDRSRGGLGLGLALVRQLVELHGGAVEAASEGLGKGTQFTIRLPRTDQSLKSTSRDRSLTRMAEVKSLRVVIIEDNPDTAHSLRMVMSLSGHRVAVAHDGTQGLEVARSFAPDVVLCDIGLPGSIDGYAVAQAMRQDFDLASVFLIATTGYGQDQDRRMSQRAGFDVHLTKPVDPAELQRILATVSARLVTN